MFILTLKPKLNSNKMLRMHKLPKNTGAHSTNIAIINLNKYIHLTTNIKARLDKKQKFKYQGSSSNS